MGVAAPAKEVVGAGVAAVVIAPGARPVARRRPGFGRIKEGGQPARVGLVHRVVVAVGVPVVAVPRRVLADEPPRPAVVVAVPQELQPAVGVRLVARLLVPRLRRRVGAEPADRVAEGIPVVAVRVSLVAVQQAPRVALRVGQVEHTGVSVVARPVRLGDAGRERRVAVGEHGGGGSWCRRSLA